MTGARLIGVISALILLSGFMPWFNGPFGGKFVPFDYFQQLLDLINGQPEILREAPLSVLIFIAAWIAAAMLALTGILIDWSPRLLAMFVGLAPIASFFLLLAEVNQATQTSLFGGTGGLFSEFARQVRIADISSSEFLDQILRPIFELLEPGAKLYLGAVLVILLLSVLMPSRRAVRSYKQA